MDVDEFVVVDPITKRSLSDYIDNYIDDAGVIAPIGGHLIFDRNLVANTRQYLFDEAFIRNSLPKVDMSKSLLSQLRRLAPDARYCKPCVFSVTCEMSTGGHFVRDADVKIDPNLLLLHAKYCDFETLIGISDEFKGAIDNRHDLSNLNLREINISTSRLRGVKGELNKLLKLIKSDDNGSLEAFRENVSLGRYGGYFGATFVKQIDSFYLSPRFNRVV